MADFYTGENIMNLNACRLWLSRSMPSLFTLAVFLISIWALTLYANHILREDMRLLLGKQELSTVTLVAAELNHELHERMEVLEEAASKITPAILGSATSRQAFLKEQSHLSAMFSAGNLIFDSGGTAIADTPLSAGLIGNNFADRDYLIEALRGKSAIGKPVMWKKMQSPIFVMSTPVRDTKGNIIAVLTGATNLGASNFLSSVIDTSYGKTGGYLLIAPQHNLIVSATDKKRIMTPIPSAGKNRLFDQYMQGSEGFGITVDPHGTEELTASKKIPVAAWSIIVSMPSSEAFAPINSMQRRLIMASLLLTLLAIGLSAWHIKIQEVTKSLQERVVEGGKELHRSEERFRSFVENLNDVLFALTPEGVISYISPQWEVAFGYTPDESIGQSFKPFVHPDDFPACLKFLQRVIETGEKQDGVEYRVLCKGGSYLWYRANASLVIDPVSGTRTFVGIGRDITQRKLTDQKLKESEELYHSLVETSQDLIWRCDAEGKFVYLNLAWEHILGYEMDEMIGKSVNDFQVGENAEDKQTIFSRLMQDESLDQYETTHIGKSGDKVHLVFNALSLSDENGNFSGASGTAYNITERKRMEDNLHEMADKLDIQADELRQFNEMLEQRMYEQAVELEEQHGRLEGIIKSTNVGTWEWNIQTGKTVFNKRWAEIIGYRLTEISPVSINTWVKFCHPDDLKASNELLEKHFRGELDYYVFESRMKHKNGNWVWVLDQGKVSTWDEEGKPLLMLGTHQDITERKQAEILLLESKNRIDQLTEQSGTMIWEVDADGLYRYVNNQSESIFGYRPEELVDRMHFYDLFPESEREAIKKTAFGLFERTEQILNIESQTITRDGRHIWWTTNAIPILGDNGTLLGYRGTDTNITESKKLKDQLFQSQKMESVGQLAGGLAHDFNNVLSIINAYCCMIQMDMEPNEKLTEYVGNILSASNRAGELTHSMLAFSRTQVMNSQQQNLNEVVSKVGTFVEKIIGENILFSIVIKEATLPVFVDSGQIEQILFNLANNARDAMPGGGELKIVTDIMKMNESFIFEHGFGKAGEYAVITVADTGTGMNEATQRKVFEPFFTTKTVDKGTGLGLAMVYGITKQHKGFVDVSSEEGHGACFSVYLPINRINESESEIKTVTDLEASAGTETILIADDNADLLEFMYKMLTKLGYRVIRAVDGQDAVDKFRENADSIRLIIMDMIMPGKSGRVAYEEIKEIRPDTLALFSSAYSSKIIKEQVELGPFAECISKPVQPAALMKKVREMLDRA